MKFPLWLKRGIPLLSLLPLLAGLALVAPACAPEPNPLPPATETPPVAAGRTPATAAATATTNDARPTPGVTPPPPTPTLPPPTLAPPEAEIDVTNADTPFSIPAGKVPPELVARRPEYDTTADFAALLKPHFLARTATGNLVEVDAPPGLMVEIVEWEGRVALRLAADGVDAYVDLLALQSELLGEHPAHKIYRLLAMGIPISDDLRRKLAGPVAGELFTNVEFEYLRGRTAAGVVAEVFPDGTLLVIPFDLPPEWQSRDDRIASPTHLHLNPRALSAGVSDLAREYEREILALPFPEQRYPAAPLARKQCDLYRESLNHPAYADLMTALGFRFTPQHVTGDLAEAGAPFGERIQALLWGGSGAGVQYFGFESDWIADILRREQVEWLGECDTAGGIRRYPVKDDAGDANERYYIIARRSLEPDKKQRYKILALDAAGAAEEIYTAPGIILLALPLPYDDRTWLLSSEGWPAAEGDAPADPRWQSVYLVNLTNPEEYQKVQYPIAQFPDAPAAGLYGVSPRLSGDLNYLFNTLYGFRDEGGGIWVVDVSAEGFHAKGDNFSRIVAWDHTLSWTLLDGPAAEDSPDSALMHVFMTGKEVADDFAMTANILRIRDAGLESSIEREERLLQMVGWNPVPFGWQQLSDTRYRVLVETHYNYESSLLPRAKGVYIIPVDLGDVAGG